jgi:hypothetical protein
MSIINKLRTFGIHIGKLSFYLEPYLTDVKTEYWNGSRRKRVLKIKNLTVWIADQTEE